MLFEPFCPVDTVLFIAFYCYICCLLYLCLQIKYIKYIIDAPVDGDPTGILPRSLATENYSVPRLLCGVVYVVLCLAGFVELRLVIDKRTDGNSTTVHTAIS